MAQQPNYKENLKYSLLIFAISLVFLVVAFSGGGIGSGMTGVFGLAVLIVGIGAFFYGLWGIFQSLYFLFFRRRK